MTTMRVIGFDFAVSDTVAAADTCRRPERRRHCPVSPLGDMLNKYDCSSDDQSRGSDSQYTDSDGYYGHGHDADDYSYGSHDGYSWGQAQCYEETTTVLTTTAAPMDVDAAPFFPGQPKATTTVSVTVTRMTSSTSSDPIPIPKKPKAPKVQKVEEPKNLKRVPEPPMLRAVTAPAIVEEAYAEYYRLKQIAEDEELYQQMMLAQGQKPRRRLKTTSTTGMDLGTEMDKLSWRTVYTYMQSDTLPQLAAVSSACHCK